MTSGENININIARSRIDLYIAGTGRQEFKDIKNNLKSNLSKLVQSLDKNIKFSRIGFVCRFFVDEENQNNTIANALKETRLLFKAEVFLRYSFAL